MKLVCLLQQHVQAHRMLVLYQCLLTVDVLVVQLPFPLLVFPLEVVLLISGNKIQEVHGVIFLVQP